MSNNNESVTTLISHKIKSGHVKDFEAWTKKIIAKASLYPGFQNVTVVKPQDPENLEYLVIVRWKNYNSLKKWQLSNDFKQIINESKSFTLSTKTIQEDTGMEIWFDWPNDIKPVLKPKFYKQVLVAIITVLPLIFLIGMITDPILSKLNLLPEIIIIINVLIVAPLITLIMPKITKLLYFWLYEQPKPRT